MPDEPYCFGFPGFRPTWFSFESLPAAIVRSFAPFLGDQLIDIDGIMSQHGWQPNYPIVLHFDRGSIAVNAMEPGEWSIESWHDYELSEEENAPELGLSLSVVSLVELLQLDDIRGTRFYSLGLLNNTRDGFCCCFGVGEKYLSITHEYDELAVRLIESSQFRPLDSLRLPKDAGVSCPACGFGSSGKKGGNLPLGEFAVAVMKSLRTVTILSGMVALLLAFAVGALWWKVEAQASRTAVSVGMSGTDVTAILGEPQQRCTAGETCHSATFPATPPDQINDGGVWRYVTRHAVVIYVYFDKTGRVKSVYSYQS